MSIFLDTFRIIVNLTMKMWFLCLFMVFHFHSIEAVSTSNYKFIRWDVRTNRVLFHRTLGCVWRTRLIIQFFSPMIAKLCAHHIQKQHRWENCKLCMSSGLPSELESALEFLSFLNPSACLFSGMDWELLLFPARAPFTADRWVGKLKKYFFPAFIYCVYFTTSKGCAAREKYCELLKAANTESFEWDS